MGKEATKDKHPKGFYACCITVTFERLAFYGAKPLLLFAANQKLNSLVEGEE